MIGSTLTLCVAAVEGGDLTPGVTYAASEPYALVNNSDIRESSGVAWGWINRNVLWTHNDSGAAPVVFAIGPDGEDRGMFTLGGAGSIDWEDMASYSHGGAGWLVLADVGNNFFDRSYHSIYFAREPDVSPKVGVKARGGTIRVEKTLRFQYEDAPHNCEAMAIDATNNRIYLATKNVFGQTGIYELPIPEAPTGQLRAKRIAEVWMNSVTAMDISADGRRAVLLTYGPAYEFVRQEGRSWAEAFSQEPRRITNTPRRKQGEAVCYGPDSRSLYFTNESRHSPLWRLAPLSP
ncbi:MAG: hypothetical protein ACYTGQ_08070 [Planctomycetota bacterium]|jgi:hypothetical protein